VLAFYAVSHEGSAWYVTERGIGVCLANELAARFSMLRAKT